MQASRMHGCIGLGNYVSGLQEGVTRIGNGGRALCPPATEREHRLRVTTYSGDQE